MTEKNPPELEQNRESIIFHKSEVTPQFAVGLHLYLEFAQKTRRTRARANLIGWWRPHVLLATSPLMDDRLVVAPSGTEVIVRYLLEGSVYGFVTRLLKKHQDPIPMWALAYPQLVEVKNLRESPRVQTFIQVQSQEDDEWLLLDLSTNGALISVNEPQVIGNTLRLNFTLPDGTRVEELSATVVRVHLSHDENTVGVLFDQENDEQIQQIQNYIESCKTCYHSRLSKEFDIDQHFD